MTAREQILEYLQSHAGDCRTADIAAACECSQGAVYTALSGLTATGEITRVDTGVYRLTGAAPKTKAETKPAARETKAPEPVTPPRGRARGAHRAGRGRALRLATALDCFEGWRDVKDAAGLLRELAAEPYKRTEQDAFEDWLEKECPSGDVSEVRRMWEASDALADFLAESRQAEPERVPLMTGAEIQDVIEKALAEWASACGGTEENFIARAVEAEVRRRMGVVG